MGIETSDDAAVYKLSDELAMIQTVDFFTPVVDDPYSFGQIAAANALSDVYAMGGTPKVALNIVGFPSCLPTDILGEILRGGADKVKEAGAVLVGGHSISDDEPKYGLCVSGFVHPARMWKNTGSRPGDALILTKPLGTGIINTAIKADEAGEDEAREAVRVMAELNRTAAGVFSRYPIHACTDVTGFGLLGHLLEMMVSSGATARIDVGALPVIDGALAFARREMVPGGSLRNREYHKGQVDFSHVPTQMIHLLWDPQTSGGLLVSLPQDRARQALRDLQAAGAGKDAALIGVVEEKGDKAVVLHGF